MSGRRLVLSWPEGEAFGQRLARALGCDHAVVATRRFPDHETYLRLPPSLAGTEVVLNCTLADPDPKLAPLLFAADTARDLGAARVGLVAPYLAYMRQDRRFEAGEAITSRSFARVLSASVDWLVTADPHLHRFASLDELYPIPSSVVRAAPLLAGWICENVERPLLVGPDAESRQWVAQAAATMGAPFAVLEKTRRGDREVELVLPDLTAHRGLTPVLIDDVAASGHTLIEAARLLAEAGFAQPCCAVTHALFAGDAFEKLRTVTADIVSTDSIPHPTNRIELAPAFAAAVCAMLADRQKP